ncbi:MAG: alpha-hydroxy-acid oxidizing protein [Proteobacteria bacterium]|nr:alpha-hydroxy-acid oxidizing protein [Pseudomonadota bacterium]
MTAIAAGLARQFQIYRAGMGGARPGLPLDADALEVRAEATMSPEAFAYVAGGAGRESTVAANRAAFEAHRIVPRMARDVSARDLSVELFGRTLPHPFLTAPIGVLSLCHPEADLAVAQASAAHGWTTIISNQASRPMEAIAEAAGDGSRWFQLYWGRSDELVLSLARRAKACGCEAIVVTLDTTLLGWRVRDLQLGHLPFLAGQGIAQYTSDPVFRALLPQPPEENPLAAALLFTQVYSDPSLTWEKMKRLRQAVDLPILVKGVQSPEDATLAVEHGFDGVVVSNHGGRQVDGAVGALHQLPLCADRVEGRIPLLFDSGLRSGADAFKALALGATAVCVGRPYAYGLALDGQSGVESVMSSFEAELELTLALSGHSRIRDLDRSALAPTRPPPGSHSSRG